MLLSPALIPTTNKQALHLPLNRNKTSRRRSISPAVPYVPQPTPVVNKPTAATNRFYSPLVLNIANSEGITMQELETIPGTGNENRVTKKDILSYLEQKKAGKVQQQPIQQKEQQTPASQAEPLKSKTSGTFTNATGRGKVI